MKKGLLLLNLGTPDEPTTPAVRRYLRQFLMDPYVIDIPAPVRWFLVNAIILPRRPAESAKLYRKVWTERGSPLLVHLQDLGRKVQEHLGSEWVVVGGMRYGNPSIESAVDQLLAQGVTELVVLPMYPQYSLAATESSRAETLAILKRKAPGLKTRMVGAFYSDPNFIDAFVKRAREGLEGFAHDFVLFSFHGLPVRQVRKTDPTRAHCAPGSGSDGRCCERFETIAPDCYRAQCFATARLMADKLGLSKDRYAVAFQSRLGRAEWIRPYTDEFYSELPAKGVKRLAVVCPAFVADCLETLEEIAIRGREDFIHQGGEDLRLVPSLNASDDWVSTVASLVNRGDAQANPVRTEATRESALAT